MDILEEAGVSQDLTEKLRLVFCTFAARLMKLQRPNHDLGPMRAARSQTPRAR